LTTIQTTFILGRFILDGVVLLHEAHKSKAYGVMFFLNQAKDLLFSLIKEERVGRLINGKPAKN
jgi:hypothetical protein